MKTTLNFEKELLCQWFRDSFGIDDFALIEKNSIPNAMFVASGTGVVSLGFPHSVFGQSVYENRIFWFPKGLPRGPSFAVVSSRIGKRADKKPRLFDAIRTICSTVVERSGYLISHQGIALDKFVQRASKLFNVPILELRPMPSKIDNKWLISTLESKPDRYVGYYETNSMAAADLSLADFLVILVADYVYSLSVRQGGNLERALSARLKPQCKLTFCFYDSELSHAKTLQKLTNDGAIPWRLHRFEKVRRVKVSVEKNVVALADFQKDHCLGDYLLHWTRECPGAWPGQSNETHVDELLLGYERQDRSKYSTLQRILAMNILLASNRVTRASTPVVCFSERTVDELSELRVFRSHLIRWDFEGVGIAIRKSRLRLSFGARKVIYGADQDWSCLSETKKPFFQLAKSANIDWTEEREWRVIGNVNLNRIPTADAFVFVDSADRVLEVARISKWPVVLLPPS